MDELYTCPQVAERYRVKLGTVWNWIRTKKLAAIRVGKEYRIRAEDLRRFEDSCRTS